jgi:2-polyprenyl-3-methyl-5-hydroxy-6-metoxy-1,4-benzoquinol methylase
MGVFKTTSIDRVKSYWDSRPCNIRHSTAEIGTRQYFDEVESRKYFVEPHILELAQFEQWRGKTVLEIGCGIGTDTVQFARAGARITAIDLSEQSVNLARQRLEVYGLNADVLVADVEQLDSTLPVQPYDLIYSFGVLHHTPQPEKAIEQLRKYMGPESELRIMLYNRWSWKAVTTFLRHGKGRFWRFDEAVAMQSEAQTGCPVTYTYSKSGVKRLLSGFDVVDVWVDHIFPYRISDYVEYRYRRVWYFALLPPPAFRWLERRIGWHLCVRAKLAR